MSAHIKGQPPVTKPRRTLPVSTSAKTRLKMARNDFIPERRKLIPSDKCGRRLLKRHIIGRIAFSQIHLEVVHLQAAAPGDQGCHQKQV